MLTSLALLFILALFLGYISQKLKLPTLIGILTTGILLGPSVLNLLAPAILDISLDLRKIALIVILLRAGLSLNIYDLRKAGTATILMMFIPATFEIIGITLTAPLLFDLSYLEAALLGSVIAAVSPAVVVPKMLHLMEEKYGTNKSIPQMITAASSVDDVFVIVLFTLFTGSLLGRVDLIKTLIGLPSAILLGLIIGAVCGYILSLYFKKKHLRDTNKVIIILSIAFLLLALEQKLEAYVSISALLAIMTLGAAIFFFYPVLAKRLSLKFQKLWVGAEILLFVLVGASVNLDYMHEAGVVALAVIGIGLCCRMAGVFIALSKSSLNNKEKLFCMIAYSPKATVQAALASVPLSMGLPCGDIILTTAVVAILITAPLGAIGMEQTYKKLLQRE